MADILELGIPLMSNKNDSIATVFSDEPGDALHRGFKSSNNSWYATAVMFGNVTVPLICALGIIGNTMAIVTFMSQRLRHTSFNFYLAIRSLSDTIFLLSLLCVWLDYIRFRLFHTPVICQLIVFSSYVSSFLSVWCVVATTFENYIRICHLSRVNQLCALSNAKKCVALLSFIAIFFYQLSLWITEVHDENGRYVCMTNDAYRHLHLFITYADTLITFVLPLCAILSLSFLIIVSVVHSYRRKLRLRSKSHINNVRFSTTPQAKVTRLLLSVSVIFLILHSPIYILKIRVAVFILDKKNLNVDDAAMKLTFEGMYYINFAANFVIFFVCGNTFRRSFWQLFCGRVCLRKVPMFRSVEQQTELTVLNGPVIQL